MIGKRVESRFVHQKSRFAHQKKRVEHQQKPRIRALTLADLRTMASTDLNPGFTHWPGDLRTKKEDLRTKDPGTHSRTKTSTVV